MINEILTRMLNSQEFVIEEYGKDPYIPEKWIHKLTFTHLKKYKVVVKQSKLRPVVFWLKILNS